MKIGILGGGQLGMMLYEASVEMKLDLYFLEKDASYPATQICKNFVRGDFKNYDDVLAFGKEMDVISIEIESVNTEALKALEQMGKKVIPEASIIELIKDKGAQKEFYVLNDIPTSPFFFADEIEAIIEGVKDGSIDFPFVQKSRKDGYDGKGVAVIKGEADFPKLLNAESIVEEMVDIDKEIAVIVCRDQDGKSCSFPSVEMSFDPEANLVDYLFSPSSLNDAQEQEAQSIALKVIDTLKMTGILAVELFLNQDGEILVNEVAPRPHNSGHQTIEGNHTSQYTQLLNILSARQMTDCGIKHKSLMLNILGSKGFEGLAVYEGLNELEAAEDIFVHLYGKKETRAHRKMGHVTILQDDLSSAIERSNFVKRTLKVKA